jgi:putative membrane protein
MGFIIGLLLVFRTNTAYDRWWEGRKLIGALVNTSRNLALKINALIDKNDLINREFYSSMITNYCYSMKEHLRDNRNIEELESIKDFNTQSFDQINHLPNHIAKEIFQKNKSLYDLKIISGNILLTIDDQTKLFTDIIGGCERIKKTPIPYSYNIFIKKFIFIYTITLPLGLANSFNYWTIPICGFILYVLSSLELLAEEIEDPFGSDQNDLPLDNICATIKEDVKEILK